MATRTFLDSNVLISAFKGKEPDCLTAMSLIDDPDREFVISDILKLELLPWPSYMQKAEEVEFLETFFGSSQHVVETTPERTARALQIGRKYNLRACDALHVEAALRGGATQFITAESTESPFFRVEEVGLAVVSLNQFGGGATPEEGGAG